MPKIVWDDRMYGKAALYARDGATDPEIAGLLGVHPNSFKKWRKRDPVLQDILKFARKGKSEKGGKPDGQKLSEYIYGTLDPSLRELWDEIMDWHKVKNGVRRVEQLLAERGKTARQRLFLYAMVHTAYNKTEACRLVHISPKTFDSWVLNDPEFIDMIDHVEVAKKDFFESSLVTAVAAGEVSAVIFANKTKNADRGYNEKLMVEHSGTINHQHQVVPIEELDLPLTMLKELLKAVREHKAEQAGKVIDAKSIKRIA